MSKVNIVNQSALERSKLLQNALSITTSTFEIVATQSGYSCKLAPLTNKDSFNILNSSSTEYENTRMTYRVIYNKIREFSCGQMNFETWLKHTSIGDLGTFYYGLYCATFLDEGAFRFTCPEISCGHTTDQVIRNKSLRQVSDYKEIQELTNKISMRANTLKDVEDLSLLNGGTLIELPKTKFMFELKLPSLWDLLELYRVFDEKIIKKHDDMDINALLCINGMLIPDGKGGYAPDNDKHDVLNVIDNLPVKDASALKKALTKLLEKYHISYNIKSVKCAKCGKEIKNVPINLRSILFTKIYAMR